MIIIITINENNTNQFDQISHEEQENIFDPFLRKFFAMISAKENRFQKILFLTIFNEDKIDQ